MGREGVDAVVSRTDIIAYRLVTQFLHQRLPTSATGRAAVWGLQDSAPRSAVPALHARVVGVGSDAWSDPGFRQVWGPRGAVYVVSAADVDVFTLGLLPRDDRGRETAERAADTLADAIGSDRVRKRDAYEILGERVDRLVQAGTTGRIRLRWDGRDTLVSVVAAPRTDPESARTELLRRFLGALGPSTVDGLARWTGLPISEARATWETVTGELSGVIVDGVRRAVLRVHHRRLTDGEPAGGVRLLPPGDPFLLVPDRDLLVPDPARRTAIWPVGTVQPGALLVDGELVGTWRRRGHRLGITTFDDVRPSSGRPQRPRRRRSRSISPATSRCGGHEAERAVPPSRSAQWKALSTVAGRSGPDVDGQGRALRAVLDDPVT